MKPIVYTVNEVAEMLRVTPQTVYELRNSGKLPSIKNIGKVLFRATDVNAFIGIDGEYSPYRYKQLEIENKKLAKENDELKQQIRKATSEMLLIVNQI